LAIVALALIALGAAVGHVVPRGSGIDESVTLFVIEHRTAWLTRVFRVITTSGSTAFLLPFALAVAGVSVARERSLRPVVFLTVTGAGVLLLYQSIKVIVSRPRPSLDPIIEAATGYAFPSGHAAQSAALLGAIAYTLACRAPRRWQVAAASTAIIWSGLVGMSRVYLGVHWMTDVIGGWTLGVIWLLAARSVLTPMGSRR
jgi:undecaprenyl-diphosphatase